MPLRPRKQFGQHFIRDQLVLERIIHAITPKPENTFLEIGPGKGALTQHLISHTEKVNAVEIDRDLCAMLEARFGHRLKLHRGDILDFNPIQIQADDKLRIVGNLPYNISSPLLFHLFDAIHHIRDMHFMLQLEVAQRLIAGPGNKAYSKLSIISACMVRTQLLFEVEAEAFSPPPKVTSAFVRITPMPRIPDEEQRKLFSRLVRTAFTHRRKTLASNLKGLITPETLSELGVKPEARPESVSIDIFLDMLKYLNHE